MHRQKIKDTGVFFDSVSNTLENLSLDHNCQIIIGGDFNCHLDSSLDNLGGRIESKSSVKKINEIMTANDLIDIWRIRNPDKKQFTWTQKKPLIRRRLDYWNNQSLRIGDKPIFNKKLFSKGLISLAD